MKKLSPKQAYDLAVSKAVHNPSTGCLEYQGRGSKGYGVGCAEGHRRKLHCLAWEVEKGEVFTRKSNRWILHRCDNRKCFNIAHLYVGTSSKNMLDCRDRGNRVSQKLKILQAALIKSAVQQGEMTQAFIADLFGVHQSTVSRIAAGLRWFNHA